MLSGKLAASGGCGTERFHIPINRVQHIRPKRKFERSSFGKEIASHFHLLFNLVELYCYSPTKSIGKIKFLKKFSPP